MTQSNITITDVAKYPRPGLAIPTAFAFSPDDTLITCLFSAQGDLSQQLYAYDPRTGERRLLATPPGGGDSEETLSLEEKLRRERRRQLALGITRYAWARERARLLIPLQDGVYVQDGAGAPLRKVLGTEDGPILDPQLSREGRHLAYVQDAELYVLALEDGTPRQLTTGARDTGKTHGLAEFVAQEEMHRYHGFWWSPDGAQLAFTEVDETHIPSYRIVHQGKETVIHEDHGYPFAGAENARVRLGIISSAGGAPLWLDLGEDAEYLARVAWFPDGALSVQVENRAQTRLQLLRFDSQTGARTRLLEERTDVWINLHTMWTPLKDGRFIWASERTGFMHLYLCDREGAVIRPLTEGDWVVDSVAGVDEENGIVYFTGTLTSPLERHLYAVPLDGGEIRKITRAPGTHQIVLDHGRERFIDIHSSLAHPPAVTLRATQDGRLLQTLYDEPDPRIAALAPEPPALVTLKSRDGVTLYGALYRPGPDFGPGPYPTIVYVYGGPHLQLVVNRWDATVDLRAQYWRDHGFAVFKLDNRGSAGRGLAFEGAIKHNMGDLEVQDQVDGVRWLVAQGIADPERVGITGWSYGGYMSAMCLARTPEVFKAAAAGAPVTHLDGYDTHYTERYMGVPRANPQGYTSSSVMHHVGEMRGKLLLIHGLIDENVHFRHTARLINALIRAQKPYELLLFPDERHLPRGLADRMYMEKRILEFFQENL